MPAGLAWRQMGRGGSRAVGASQAAVPDGVAACGPLLFAPAGGAWRAHRARAKRTLPSRLSLMDPNAGAQKEDAPLELVPELAAVTVLSIPVVTAGGLDKISYYCIIGEA